MNWLSSPSMLPNVIPFHRTICIGYDLSSVARPADINYEGAAEKLLEIFDDKRKACDTRPAIFIGHGLCCRVVQNALMRPSNNDRVQKSQAACAGVLFHHVPPDDTSVVTPESVSRAQKHSPHLTAASHIIPVTSSPQKPSLSDCQTSSGPSFLHHILQHGPSGRDQNQCFRFATNNHNVFRLLSAKIVEWSEIHRLMKAVT